MLNLTDNQELELWNPGKKVFDFSSLKIEPNLSAVLGFLFESFIAMRRNHFNPSIIHRFLIKAIAVVRLIANEHGLRMLGKAYVNCSLNQRGFLGESIFYGYNDSKIVSVSDCHDLGALAVLCLGDSEPVFLPA